MKEYQGCHLGRYETAEAAWALGWLRKWELQTPGLCELCMNLFDSFPRCQVRVPCIQHRSAAEGSERPRENLGTLQTPTRPSSSFLTSWQLIKNSLFCSFSGFIFLVSFLFHPNSSLSFPTRNPLQFQHHSSFPILPALHHWGWHLGWM